MSTEYDPQLGSGAQATPPTEQNAPHLGSDAQRLHAIDALSSPDVGLRHRATAALAQSRDAETLDLLLTLLNDPAPQVQVRAAQALGNRRERDAVPALLEKIRVPQAELRGAAVHALGLIQDRRAYEPLLISLFDPDLSVRGEALAALGGLGGPHTAGMIADYLNGLGYTHHHSLHADARTALARLAVRYPTSVMLLTTHPNARVAETVIEALGLAFDQLEPDYQNTLTSLVIGTLDSGEVLVRRAALASLGLMGMATTAPEIRARVVKAIGGLLNPSAESGALELRQYRQAVRFRAGLLLLHGDQYVLSSALYALFHIAQADAAAVRPLVEAAIRLSSHPTQSVRLSAVMMLSASLDERAIPALAARLGESSGPEMPPTARTFADGETIASTARHGLLRIGTAAAHAALESCDHD